MRRFITTLAQEVRKESYRIAANSSILHDPALKHGGVGIIPLKTISMETSLSRHDETAFQAGERP